LDLRERELEEEREEREILACVSALVGVGWIERLRSTRPEAALQREPRRGLLAGAEEEETRTTYHTAQQIDI